MTGLEPVFGCGHVFASYIECFSVPGVFKRGRDSNTHLGWRS